MSKEDISLGESNERLSEKALLQRMANTSKKTASAK
jgi:hypothetical protein